jgi:hypothetical protein
MILFISIKYIRGELDRLEDSIRIDIRLHNNHKGLDAGTFCYVWDCGTKDKKKFLIQ